MLRERSTSFPSLPCLNSSSTNVCRTNQDSVMVHKHLHGRNSSSFCRTSLARNANGPIPGSKQLASIKPKPTPVTPPETILQFDDFVVDLSTVSPLEAVSLAEDMAADFYSEISIMYDMLSDIKEPTAEARAVDELMSRLNALLSANAYRCATDNSLSARIINVRGLYNGLVRVFVFLYHRYYHAFVVLEVNEMLAASWQRLLAFVIEYHILDQVFVTKVYNHVVQIVAAER